MLSSEKYSKYHNIQVFSVQAAAQNMAASACPQVHRSKNIATQATRMYVACQRLHLIHLCLAAASRCLHTACTVLFAVLCDCMRCLRLILFTLEAELLCLRQPKLISPMSARYVPVTMLMVCCYRVGLCRDNRTMMNAISMNSHGSLQSNIPSFTTIANGSVWPACLCLCAFFLLFHPLCVPCIQLVRVSDRVSVLLKLATICAWKGEKMYCVPPNLSIGLFDLYEKDFD